MAHKRNNKGRSLAERKQFWMLDNAHSWNADHSVVWSNGVWEISVNKPVKASDGSLEEVNVLFWHTKDSHYVSTLRYAYNLLYRYDESSLQREVRYGKLPRYVYEAAQCILRRIMRDSRYWECAADDRACSNTAPHAVSGTDCDRSALWEWRPLYGYQQRWVIEYVERHFNPEPIVQLPSEIKW